MSDLTKLKLLNRQALTDLQAFGFLTDVDIQAALIDYSQNVKATDAQKVALISSFQNAYQLGDSSIVNYNAWRIEQWTAAREGREPQLANMINFGFTEDPKHPTRAEIFRSKQMMRNFVKGIDPQLAQSQFSDVLLDIKTHTTLDSSQQEIAALMDQEKTEINNLNTLDQISQQGQSKFGAHLPSPYLPSRHIYSDDFRVHNDVDPNLLHTLQVTDVSPNFDAIRRSNRIELYGFI